MSQQDLNSPLENEFEAGSENRVSYLEITGMGCVNCGKRIQNALMKVHGVSEVSIDHQAGLGQVTYTPQATSEALLIQAVRDAGDGGHHNYAAWSIALKD